MNKRASLSLSINAVVILVLAIAMLGLGLGFTKGMFAKFASKLDVPPPNIPATSDEPVVLPQEELTIKHGKDFAFSVNFYNDYSTGTVTPGMICQTYTTLFPISSPQDVSGGTYKGFKFIIPGKGDGSTESLIEGTDICTISFTVGAEIETKQITIKIT